MSERSKETRLEEHKADNKLETRNVRHQSCGSVDAVRTIYRGVVRLDRPSSGATSYSLSTAHRGPPALILNKCLICESHTKGIAAKNPVDKGHQTALHCHVPISRSRRKEPRPSNVP
jgi:hypothetical protein